ncbi:MAG: ATP synthase subunit delta [candidate division CPR2 bacterium GW2011_GWC1_39_9]|uniref:ATP synthase subunit delta n=1 Tax=candidate division CPR2 bacterium GW2011_GWC2_39_10 TaxID=1618345 RepID=A0A0G0LTL8_UNCC2|nr:MAG: ATP synthase subunit delta [candidate division CPR2 bacterium GW2011_GWC2_39_10]KKR36060.1 MAG: ATP synthase subunit delta [candidate division CPR2 bacterium GW2011_GWC1_39_9]
MIGSTQIAKVLIKQSAGKDASDINRYVSKIAKAYPNKIKTIARSIRNLSQFDAGYIEITSAKELSELERNEIVKSLKIGDPINIKFRVNNNIVAGIIIKIGETVIDGSGRERINQIKERIINTTL